MRDTSTFIKSVPIMEQRNPDILDKVAKKEKELGEKTPQITGCVLYFVLKGILDKKEVLNSSVQNW